MSDGGSFWHDFEEHVIIWEDDSAHIPVDAVALPEEAHPDALHDSHGVDHGAHDSTDHLIDVAPADHVVAMEHPTDDATA